MIIVTLHYKTTIEEVDKYLSAHRDFLDYHYKQGLFLASGPMNPRTGGIIIALTNDAVTLQSILKQDPFAIAGIAEYQLTEFSPIKHREEIKNLIVETEGKLC